MSMSRRQKANLNIISTSFLELVTLINGLILPRLIIRTYGSAYNGITSSVTQFLALISILNIGVTASTRVALYRTLADHDIHATSRIVRATELYMRKVGVVLGVYIIILAIVYPLAVKTGFSYIEVSSLILIIGVNSFAHYYFGITYECFLYSDQCIYISNVFSIISILLSLIISVILIRFGFSIQIVKLGSASVFVLKPIFQGIYVRKNYKLERHCDPDMSALNNRKDTMMHALANIVHQNTDLVVLTLLTDVKTVSVYTVYNLVMGALSKTQKIFTTGIEPIFGNMWAKKEMNLIKKNLSVYEFFISVFVSIAFSTTFVMIIPFVSLYTLNVNDVNYIRPIYSGVIVIAFVFFAFRSPYLALVQGIGHYRETRTVAIMEAVINLTLSVALVLLIPVKEYKMVGVAIGTLVANLFRTVQYAFYLDKNIIKRGKSAFILRLIWTLFNMSVIIIPSYFYISSTQIDTWLSWILYSFLIVVFSVIFSIISSFIFYKNDFIYGLQLALSLLNRKR